MSPHTKSPRIDGIRQIAENYDAILCDVWGVVHNGVAAWPGATDALSRFKKLKKPTFLLTNAPRPNSQVVKQLAKLHVPDESFDQVVTSGDVTRELITSLNQPIFHIGTPSDKSIFTGLNVDLVDWTDAKAVICTGLYDDFTQTPDDYTELLGNLKSRDLNFICANPDIVVEHGNIMRWCAGALAQKYAQMGGKTQIIGKPHKTVYQHAHALLDLAAGKKLEKSRILAIGDGINTDIAGALGYGLDVVYISAGIHSGEYGDADNPDADQVQQFLTRNLLERQPIPINKMPVAWMPRLAW